MSIFAIGIGGSGGKCLEALTHLHACGILKNDNTTVRLCTFLVEPDQKSTLLARAETAIERYQKMRTLLREKTQVFARGDLHHYGTWSPLSSASVGLSLDQVFPKAVLRTQAGGLADLFDSLFSPEEQGAVLDVGFRGRPAIGAAVISRVNPLATEDQPGEWKQMLNDIKMEVFSGEAPIIHLFGSVFGGTGASGVPSLAQMLKSWLKQQGLHSVRVNASLLLPYFGFEGFGQEDTGVDAVTGNFLLNTEAALRYLSIKGTSCLDNVYLIGSDSKANYRFSVGGRSQINAAHVVELLAGLGMLHSLKQGAENGFAYVLSRAGQNRISWNDIPDNEAVGEALARGTRFAVAWLNNFSLELDAAKQVSIYTFLSGAPWARHFFQPTRKATEIKGGRSSIRSSNELRIKAAIDAYTECLLQWLHEFSSNTGSGISQELFTPSLLKRNFNYDHALGMVVRGSARPRRDERHDTIEAIKLRMDELRTHQIHHNGVAGLAETLWSLSY
jgi:hypothetical protein